jgi:hypothetical protein
MLCRCETRQCYKQKNKWRARRIKLAETNRKIKEKERVKGEVEKTGTKKRVKGRRKEIGNEEKEQLKTEGREDE